MNSYISDTGMDGLRIFLNYVKRQINKNPDYNPHSLIRAFLLANQGIDQVEDGQIVVGLSHEGTEDSVYEPYSVVLQKQKDGIEIKEIKHLKFDMLLPVDVMIIIFRLQMKLDKIQEEALDAIKVANLLNSVIPGNRFYALGDRWVEARELFGKRLREGKVILPNKKIADELVRIKPSTPWENYSSQARSLIGTCIAETLDDKENRIIITAPTSCLIEKFKICELALEFIIGNSAKFFQA